MNTTGVDQVLAQIRAIKQQTAKPVSPLQNLQQPQPTQQAQPVKDTDFSAVLTTSINKVNETQQAAAQLQQAFELGDKDTSIAEVMVAMQKADVSFKAITQVRNKLVDAYREVMRMSV